MNIRYKKILLFLSFLFIPIFVHSLMTFGNAVVDNDWISFFGNYFGAIVGVMAAVLISRTQIKSSKEDLLEQIKEQNKQVKKRINNEIYVQKLSTRVFINYTLTYDDAILSTKNEDDNEILLHYQMNKFIEHNDNEFLKTAITQFVRIEYFGSAEAILDVSIRLVLQQEDETQYVGHIYRTGIKKDRNVYISLHPAEAKSVLTKIVMEYTTLSQERIKFISDLLNNKEEYLLVENGNEELIYAKDVPYETYINPGNKLSTN